MQVLVLMSLMPGVIHACCSWAGGGEVALCQIAALQVVGNTLQMHICGSGVGVGLVRCYGLVEWWPAAAVAV